MTFSEIVITSYYDFTLTISVVQVFGLFMSAL